jgi:catechol 2,3-dioxygenase-like lactoylglutathione lyase family enzyme
MIKRLSHAGVPVLDQDSAKAFYTDKLGFEVRTDVTMDGFRWLTVSPHDQPDLEFILLRPGPPHARRGDRCADPGAGGQRRDWGRRLGDR